MARQGRRPYDIGRISGVGGNKPRPADRQRTRLVESDGVDLRQTLKRRPILDHDAAAEEFAGGHDLDDGNGEAERAGAGDDQHRDGNQHRLFPVAADEAPTKEGRERQEVDDGRIERGRAVGDPPVAGAAAFGRFHQADDFGKQRVPRKARGADRQRAGEVHRAGTDRLAGPNRDRAALARYDRQVEIAAGATSKVTGGLAVTFVGVSGDSRCPADANCITGGDATVKLNVSPSWWRRLVSSSFMLTVISVFAGSIVLGVDATATAATGCAPEVSALCE